MSITTGGWIALGLAAVGGVAIAFTFERPPVQVVQRGFRGTAMEQVYTSAALRAGVAHNQVPEPEPTTDPLGVPSSEAYQNVQVLGGVDAGEFLRLMTAITAWVSPEGGCNYCHNPENLAEDSVYTKVVARRMTQMVQHINAEWKSHVGETGVTCHTCHRGNPVPSQIWFRAPDPSRFYGLAETRTGQNLAAASTGLSSLPYDFFTPFLDRDGEVRVQGGVPLPSDNRQSIKQTEWTYGLMMHFSGSLGVNCTYCHNTRAFGEWEQSTPQRTVAWNGLRMVRDLNVNYMEPLTAQFPRSRLGPEGDVAKVSCATCHQGAFKPLYGASMLKDYPELAGPTPAPAATAASAPAPAEAPASQAEPTQQQ